MHSGDHTILLFNSIYLSIVTIMHINVCWLKTFVSDKNLTRIVYIYRAESEAI